MLRIFTGVICLLIVQLSFGETKIEQVAQFYGAEVRIETVRSNGHENNIVPMHPDELQNFHRAFKRLSELGIQYFISHNTYPFTQTNYYFDIANLKEGETFDGSDAITDEIQEYDGVRHSLFKVIDDDGRFVGIIANIRDYIKELPYRRYPGEGMRISVYISSGGSTWVDGIHFRHNLSTKPEGNWEVSHVDPFPVDSGFSSQRLHAALTGCGFKD